MSVPSITLVVEVGQRFREIAPAHCEAAGPWLVTRVSPSNMNADVFMKSEDPKHHGAHRSIKASTLCSPEWERLVEAADEDTTDTEVFTLLPGGTR